MLREIRLSSFKRFLDQSLALAPLTILTGFNSGGKSSALHGIALLHHAAVDAARGGSSTGDVALNGPGLALGDLQAVRNETAPEDTFTLGLTTSDVTVDWTLGWPNLKSDSLAVPVKRIVLNGVAHEAASQGDLSFAPEILNRTPGSRALLDLLARARFVPADRLGPAETYPLDDPARHATPGPRAERMFGNLRWRDLDPLPVPEMRHASDPSPLMRRQAEAWLSELFSVTRLEPRPVQHANLFTLGVQTSADLGFHRPQNVGFGLTYVLPVILAILTASKGDLVLVENPEAHLHPSAQSRIARFFAKAAAAGIQIIVETHSDHILNGARVAVHAGQIEKDDVSILFFARPGTPPSDMVTQIEVNRQGQLTKWPAGFFDETDHLLDRLLEPVES